MNISYDKQYLNVNSEAPDRWHEFRQSRLNFRTFLKPVGEFTPVLRRACSDIEKERLFYLFTVLNAEAQIVLEQFFIFALREFRRTSVNSDVSRAAKKLMREEMLHSRAYRQFLRGFSILNWPRENLVCYRQKRLKKTMAWFLKISPVSMILTAAKFETYSLYFSHYLNKVYVDKNEWTELNRLHVVDEVHHVNFDYAFYDAQVKAMGVTAKLSAAIFGALFFLGMQVLLFRSCLRAVTYVFPAENFYRRIRYALEFAYWGVRVFPPYEKTRERVRENFQQKRFVHSKLLGFIYW